MNFTQAARSVRISGANRVQTRPGIIRYHNDEYSTVEFEVDDEFATVWVNIESKAKEYANKEYPWNSQFNPYERTIRIKYDDDTMFFNEKGELIDKELRIGSKMIALIELNSVYTFHQKCGIGCRLHQVMVFMPECVL